MTTTLPNRIADMFRYLVRFAALIGIIISSAILLYNLLSRVFIGDEEYTFSRSWEIEQCNQPLFEKDSTTERTQEEKDTCLTEARERLIKTRAYELKHTMILSFSWLFVCGIVYGLFWNWTRKEER